MDKRQKAVIVMAKARKLDRSTTSIRDLVREVSQWQMLLKAASGDRAAHVVGALASKYRGWQSDWHTLLRQFPKLNDLDQTSWITGVLASGPGADAYVARIRVNDLRRALAHALAQGDSVGVLDTTRS